MYLEVSLAGYVHTYAFHFITLAMWGSAMNYYFENYVDAGALYAFLDRLGLGGNGNRWQRRVCCVEYFRAGSQFFR